jgi:hypothetical protein
MRNSIPVSLVSDGNGRLAAYREGCEAAITYLAEKFGTSLNKALEVKKPQTRELRLWGREELKQDLQVAWKVMHAGQSLLPEQDPCLIAFYLGIAQTLNALAESFDVEGLTLPTHNGSA